MEQGDLLKQRKFKHVHLKTERVSMLSRLMIELRPVNDTVAVQDDPQVYHEAGTLNIDDETLRERMETDMDFKIPGLPHSIVIHAQSTSVRQLIQKIENHPNRHALQQDLRQNQSFNPFSPE